MAHLQCSRWPCGCPQKHTHPLGTLKRQQIQDLRTQFIKDGAFDFKKVYLSTDSAPKAEEPATWRLCECRRVYRPWTTEWKGRWCTACNDYESYWEGDGYY